MTKLSAVSILIALHLISCVYPPFDASISLAYYTASKMELDDDIRVRNVPGYQLESVVEKYEFIPEQLDFSRGFLLVNDVQLSIFYVSNGLDDIYVNNVNPGMLDYPLNGGELNYRAISLPTAGASYLVHTNIEPLTATNNWMLNVLEFNHGTEDFDQTGLAVNEDVLTISQGLIPTLSDITSAGIADVNGNQKIRLLGKKGGTSSEYHEVTFDLTPAPPGMSSGDDIRSGMPVTLPDIGASCYYYFHPGSGSGGTGIVSFYDNGEYFSYKWDDNSLDSPIPLNISLRISALLSTGELFCRSENYGYVYDLEESRLKYGFPMGDLRFVFEMWDVNTESYKMVFTMPLLISDYSGSELSIRVFSIPTDELGRLD